MVSTFTHFLGSVSENVTSFYTFLVSLDVCLFQCTICLPHMRKLPLFSVRYFLMCQSRVSLSSVKSFMRARTHTDWSHTLMSASEASSTLFCCRWALLETGLKRNDADLWTDAAANCCMWVNFMMLFNIKNLWNKTL